MAKKKPELKRVTKKGEGVDYLIKEVKTAILKVGVLFGTGAHPQSNGALVAEIAFWNEFGTKRIPPRPFLRTTISENRRKYRQQMIQNLKAIMNKKLNSKTAIATLGMIAQSDIQRKITEIKSPKNAPLTNWASIFSVLK